MRGEIEHSEGTCGGCQTRLRLSPQPDYAVHSEPASPVLSKYGKRAEAGGIPVAEVNLRDHSRLLQTLAAFRSCRLLSQWT